MDGKPRAAGDRIAKGETLQMVCDTANYCRLVGQSKLTCDDGVDFLADLGFCRTGACPSTTTQRTTTVKSTTTKTIKSTTTEPEKTGSTTCPPLEDTDTIHYEEEPEEGNAIGSSRSFSCKEEEAVIEGESTVICQEDGTWTEPGTCTKTTPEPTTPAKSEELSTFIMSTTTQKPDDTGLIIGIVVGVVVVIIIVVVVVVVVNNGNACCPTGGTGGEF